MSSLDQPPGSWENFIEVCEDVVFDAVTALFSLSVFNLFGCVLQHVLLSVRVMLPTAVTKIRWSQECGLAASWVLKRS